MLFNLGYTIRSRVYSLKKINSLTSLFKLQQEE